MNTFPALSLCYCTHPKQPHRPAFYVSALPGHEGVDWGYTLDPKGTPNPSGPTRLDVAKPLSPYWARRFRADCRRVGMTFHSLPA